MLDTQVSADPAAAQRDILLELHAIAVETARLQRAWPRLQRRGSCCHRLRHRDSAGGSHMPAASFAASPVGGLVMLIAGLAAFMVARLRAE